MGELSGLTLTAIKLGFLAVLWVFVLTAVSVMRSDLFGTRVSSRPPAPGSGRGPGDGRGGGRAAKPAKPKRGTPRSLVVTEGSLAGTSVRLGDAPVVIGRSQDCTIVLTDDFASGRHARLFPANGGGGGWYVEDLGSTNGTYLDRTKLTGPTPAPLGVPIRVGKTVLELRK